MYLDNAVKALNELPTSKVEVVSEYLVTPPYGVTDQPDFLEWLSETSHAALSI